MSDYQQLSDLKTQYLASLEEEAYNELIERFKGSVPKGKFCLELKVNSLIQNSLIKRLKTEGFQISNDPDDTHPYVWI